MRYRKDQMKLTERRKLAKLIIKFCEERGGKQVSSYTFPKDCLSDGKPMANAGETHYEYEIDTPLGLLEVSFATDGDHLHCCFKDVKLAQPVMNPTRTLGGTMNPHSGKYNAYAFADCSAGRAFHVFEEHLADIWTKCGQTPPWEVAKTSADAPQGANS